MTGESTTLPSLPTMRAEWGHFFGFLKRPSLPDQAASKFGNGAVAVSRMLTLDLLLMGALLVIAGIVMTIGIEIPETALAGMEITTGIILAVVVVAPVSEEILFRSWLSGRPRYLAAFPIFAVAGIGAAMLAATHTGQTAQAYVGAALIGGILLWLVVAVFVWKRPPMGWFQRVFPIMFWLSTVVFACIHLFNFQEGNLMMMLPLVAPQFILGTLLGYLRVNYGLWTAIALHMIHNGLIIVIVLAASSAAGGS